ncbi:DNA topoisomerase IB [Changchengzhania lutea]|uniref:DNA topoisomerase IB n=1 Tax=Changchengzhania lutea TaxID=2049305 RepID=UPI00115D40E6|nr:DNA topoisomerase IB [Changchengzhania lutea]
MVHINGKIGNNGVIKDITKRPEAVLDLYNLIYAQPEMLNISRSSKTESTYIYKMNGKEIINPTEIERINNLVIPPAWKKVKIANQDNAHLQAVGRDDKNRKQYIYHPKWNVIRNQTKFTKLNDFASALPKMREQIALDIEQKAWNKTKVLAIVIRLLEESHIRVGNSYYTRKNKTYGLSTLRSRHLNISKNKLNIEFIGKKGKKNKVTIENKKLVKLVNRCEEIPGWRLFQYYDENGDEHAVESQMINEYIQEISGENFSAKDFRTWSASLICFDALKQFKYSKKESTREKHVIQAIDQAAESLNNTRAVCKKYYVHPVIINSYIDGSIDPFFKQISKTKSKSEYELQPNERALKALLKTYKPEALILE